MEQRRIPIQPEALDQLAHFDMSIGHWNQEYVKASLQLKAMLENIEGLHQARQVLLDKTCHDAGVDPAQVVQMRPMRNGETVELAVLLKPAAPPAGAGPESMVHPEAPEAPEAPPSPAP